MYDIQSQVRKFYRLLAAGVTVIVLLMTTALTAQASFGPPTPHYYTLRMGGMIFGVSGPNPVVLAAGFFILVVLSAAVILRMAYVFANR